MRQKRQFWAVLAALSLGLLAGCQNKSAEQEAFEVQTFSHSDSTEYAMISVEVDYPVTGPQSLVDSIRAWMAGCVAYGYKGDLSDGQVLVDHSFKETDTKLKAEWDEMHADAQSDDPEEMGLLDIPGEDHLTLRLAWQDDNFVTYDYEFFVYHSGGAHGLEGSSGTTFLKQDGSRMSWSDVTGKSSEEFQALLREGLKIYFGVETDVELDDVLFLTDDYNVFNLPLPSSEPCVRAEGVEFYYSEYEVASYSSGMPSFIVPFDLVSPFMSERIQSIFSTYPKQANSRITSSTGMF